MNHAERLRFVAVMPSQERPPATTETYPSYTTIVARIQAELGKKRGTQARLAEALGMDSGSFRHHMNRREGMAFDVDQLATIARVLEAPPGWPWLTWDDAEKFAAFRRLVAETRGR
jgi:transcriptional regulator with XRE-family HTH domain